MIFCINLALYITISVACQPLDTKSFIAVFISCYALNILSVYRTTKQIKEKEVSK
jgi:hypothetical protein